MQTSYDNIVLNRMKAGTNSRSPKRSTVENHNLLDDGTLICHSWNPCPESNGQFLRTAPTVLALASTVHPSSIFICSIIVNEDGSDRFEVDIRHRFESCHDGSILSLDWADSKKITNNCAHDTCKNGRIVSCAEDCRAYIWEFDDRLGLWKASQVFLNNCCAPLYCKWNNTGEKVALAMGGKHKSSSLQVCTFHEETQEWVSLQVGRREIKSSVLHLSWRPHRCDKEELVACGGCDFRLRIFNVSNGCEGSFGEQVAEFTTEDKSWVTCVAWSASGRSLAFSSHSSRIYVIDYSSFDGSGPSVPLIIVRDALPLRSLIFGGESLLIAAGYDGTLFSVDASSDQSNMGYRKLMPWKQNTSRAGDGNISCLQISNLGTGRSHISASGTGLFLIIKI